MSKETIENLAFRKKAKQKLLQLEREINKYNQKEAELERDDRNDDITTLRNKSNPQEL